MVVNRETGYLELLEENWDNVAGIGVLKPDELGKPEITRTPWHELKLNKYKDKSGYGMSTDARTLGTGYGTDGIEWNNTLQTGVYDEARQQVDGLSAGALRSWFHSGTHYNFSDAGKTFSTPAEAFLAAKFPQYEKGSTAWDGAMESLKQQDLESGSEYKEFAVQHYVDIAEQHHKIAYAAYVKKNQKTPKETKIGMFSVDGKKMSQEHALEKARFMTSGPNVDFSTDGGKFRYNTDGKGFTTVYRRMEDSTTTGEGDDKVTNTKTYYQEMQLGPNGGTISTDEALRMRGLGGIVDPLWEKDEVPFGFRPNQQQMKEGV